MGLLIERSFKVIFFGLLWIVFSTTTQGQSLQDIQNVRVDNLSDAQIEQLVKRAQASGLTEQQLESMARERGMPATEVAKLRQRIQQDRKSTRLNSSHVKISYAVFC